MQPVHFNSSCASKIQVGFRMASDISQESLIVLHIMPTMHIEEDQHEIHFQICPETQVRKPMSSVSHSEVENLENPGETSMDIPSLSPMKYQKGE